MTNSSNVIFSHGKVDRKHRVFRSAGNEVTELVEHRKGIHDKNLMKNDESSQSMLHILFTTHELAAIEKVIEGYIRYLVSFPDEKRDIAVLERVKERLQTQQSVAETSNQLDATPEEITELLAAMDGFVKQIHNIFPKDDERDKVVNTVNIWQFRLNSILSEHHVK